MTGRRPADPALRAVKRELTRWIPALEALARRNPRVAGQLEALRHIATVIRHHQSARRR